MPDVFLAEQKLLRVVRKMAVNEIAKMRVLASENALYHLMGDLADAVDDLHEADLEKPEDT